MVHAVDHPQVAATADVPPTNDPDRSPAPDAAVASAPSTRDVKNTEPPPAPDANGPTHSPAPAGPDGTVGHTDPAPAAKPVSPAPADDGAVPAEDRVQVGNKFDGPAPSAQEFAREREREHRAERAARMLIRPVLTPKVVVKAREMAPELQRVAIELAVSGLSRFELERDLAQYLKKQFDERFQPTWHCIIGRHFGSYVTHENNAFIYFYIDKLAVLLFKSGDVMPGGA